MNKVFGIFGLLVFVYLLTALLSPDFVSAYNLQNTLRWTALFGIISLGAAFVIITGGIELSVGSQLALIGCLLPMCLSAMSAQAHVQTLGWTFFATGTGLALIGGVWLYASPFREHPREGWLALLVPFRIMRYAAAHRHACGRPTALLLIGLASLAVGLCLPDVPLPEWVAIALVLVWMIEVAVMVGLLHGVLITQLGLQPFVVTLCGLLSYRGLARWLTGDSTQGFGTSYVGLKTLVSGLPCRLTLLLAAVGVGLVAWGGWRAIAQRRSPGAEPPLVAHVTLIAVGLILAVTSGLGHLGLGGSPGPAEATLTQRAWFDCGVAGLLLGGIVLSLAALRGRRWWALASEGIAVVGAVTVCLVRTWLPQCGAGLLGRWPQVLAVTAGLAAAMAGGVWFVRSLWRDAGLAVRSTVFVTLAAGLFALAALTPLARVRVPAPFLLLVVLAVLSAVFLNLTIYGRYLLALGRNEAAARYSGVNTKAMICMAYVLCAGLTGVGGILFALEINAIQPAGHGNFYELYAIAGAVLGGCSLRGGEGSIVGVVIGTAVLRVLYNAINMLGVPTQLEFAFIGGVILAGAIVDEILKRLAEQQARRQV